MESSTSFTPVKRSIPYDSEKGLQFLFGKYKGQYISDVWESNPKYITWIMTTPNMNQKLKEYIVKQPFYAP